MMEEVCDRFDLQVDQVAFFHCEKWEPIRRVEARHTPKDVSFIFKYETTYIVVETE